MSLRFIALRLPIIRSLAGKILVLCLFFYAEAGFGQNDGSFGDVKKEADKLFKEEDYVKAYKLYSQLVSNFPKDPDYNFRLGVCMIYAEPDKKKCLPYLKIAANAGAEAPKESEFYLGKGFHINYQFDEAIKHYNTYKLSASASQVKKLQVDREIKSAANGKHLLSNLTDLEVLSKTQLSESDYFRNYKKIGGKLLVKPDEFRTSADKKKKEKSVVFLPTTGDMIYFSSYGEDDKNGRDIYVAYKQANGSFGKPEKVKGINTEFDEDYPFLHPDGKTLYFASKGYNSMGGYDIFKSVYNEGTASWESPVNMEFPINSPDDDYLFVTDSLETIAYFSTGRQSAPGKIDVLKVKTTRRPIDILAVTGKVIPGSPDYPLTASITIKDLFSDATIGNYNSEENGEYSLEVPNGSKLVFTVETPGLETQSAQVTLPFTKTSKPFRQTISYESGKLKVLNYFDEPAKDDDYLKYLKVIEKKAKLDVNEGENKMPESGPVEPAVATSTTNSIKNNTPSPSANTTPAKQNLSNTELSKLAKQDAGESKQEANQLNANYVAASSAGNKQKLAAEKKLAEANDALNKANEIADQDEKKVALETANEQLKAAEAEKNSAEKLLAYANALEKDAKQKQKEAELNDLYAKELEKSVKNKNSKESLVRLEDLQKQISEAAAYKSESEEITNVMKSDIEQKEKEIADKENLNASIKSNLEEIKTAISDKETELAETKKKKEKQRINTEISELKLEQEDKQKQISGNETDLKTLNEQLTSLKSDLDVTTKINAESVATTIPPVAEEKTTLVSLQKKYKDKTAVTDPGNQTSLEESSSNLTLYNSELTSLIADKKQELGKTKNTKTKQQLTAEIKQLESTRSSNQQQITSNTKQLEELRKKSLVAAQQASASASAFEPITASTGTEAVAKLDKLDKQLVTNDNENFDYNGYQDIRAQNLKIEADAKINDAIAKQKKLKDDIAISKTAIQGGSGSVGNSEELNKQAEDLFSAAQKKRNEANSQKGDAKARSLAEAKQLDQQAQDKLIEADEISLKKTMAASAVNQENIQNLINEGKSSPEDISRAKTLNEEANQALKKASDLRLEANSIENKGARLGSYSNATEKEAEALEKQKEAVDLLAKSNPSYQLKSTGSATEGTADVGSNLSSVNTGLSELAAIKIESYQKLYEANEIEIEVLNNAIKANQAGIDNTPSLKSTYIAANGKIENARSQKQKSDNGATQSEKLNLLISAVKNQNEGIKQLSSLNTAVSQSASPASNPPVSDPPVVVDDPLKALGDAPLTTPVQDDPAADPLKALGNTSVQDNEPPQAPKVTATEKTNLAEPSTTSEPAVTSTEPSAEAITVESLSGTDTTSGQVLKYFDNNISNVRSAQASPMVQSSLGKLKRYEAENKRIETLQAELAEEIADGTSSSQDPEALNKKSDEIMLDAETFNKQSADLKAEANTKSGEERDYMLARAREAEIKGQDKMIEASEYRKTANENIYKGNSDAIDELLEKSRTDNPELAQSIEEKRGEFPILKTQIKNLRDEANALNNTAKLGAISNAEEKELELIQKQNALLEELKKQYPDYVVKPYSGGTPEERTADLEKKKNAVREGQVTELINLINAFSLEYESIKDRVPANLNSKQQSIRDNAESLNSESKNLLVKAAQESDENEKIKQLTLAAKAGNAAVGQLNKLLPKSSQTDDIKGLTEIGNQIVSSNSDEGAFDTENTASKAGFKTDGLEIVRGNAYSAAKPIPINAKIADGLIFRVQIGAFKTQIPDNSFKGLSPLNGETTSNGYIRYTAGNFEKIENANAVKNDLRNLGYIDAFVVVYYNGRRITLAEAMEIMKQEGRTIDSNAPQTAGITANTNVPKAAANPVIQESVVVTKELEQINGLLYTIQVGVYARQVSKPQLLRLTPIFREQLSGGLFRYTAGIYNNPEKLLQDKDKVVSMGIRDAFVSAYLNGKRIPFAEAKEKQANDPSIKMETESPIVFGDAAASAPPRNDNPLEQLGSVATGEPAVQPFTNGVREYPMASPENGIKSDENGISFKVQIGAFSKQVPDDVAAKFSAIKSWPVENKRINGLYIYNVGNFSELKFAKQLKDELVAMGITDAFLTVYKDGTKLYGAAAENYLRN